MKMLMKVLLNISASIILILLSVQIISTTPYMLVQEGLYESHEDITWDYDYAVTQTMRYLNAFEDDLVFPSFEGGDDVLMTDRGLAHMEDVRVLYDNGRIIMAFSIVIAAVSGIYLWDRKEFWQTLKRIWIFPTVFVGVVTLAMVINFSWAFTMFHLLLFSNDLWILSGTDPLIVMLPETFFFITASIIVILIVGFHTGVMLLARKKST